MILHLDSSFRNVNQYPQPSEFEIDVNGQPPRSPDVFDARCQYFTDDYAQYSFKWIGTTMVEGLSTIENDALPVSIIPIGPDRFIIVTFSEEIRNTQNDYFVGTLFYDSLSRRSSPVVSYRREIFTVTLAFSLFEDFFPITFTEQARTIRNNNVRDGYFINPTFSTGKNLLVLGSTKLIPETETEVALAQGLNTDLYVENVTQGWTTKVQSVSGIFRSVILESFPSYHSNDFFAIWKVPTYTGKVDPPLFAHGILDFEIIHSTCGNKTGTRLETTDQKVRFEVIRVDQCGRVLDLSCLFPGQDFRQGTHISLYQQGCTEPMVVEIRITRTANGFVPATFPVNLLSFQKYIVAFMDPSTFEILYFGILEVRPPLIYLNMTDETVIRVNEFWSLSPLRAFFLIPFKTFFPSVNAPLIADQNPVCYRVRITSISLPNLPVCGINILLSDVPYLMVTLSNANGSAVENYGTLISNNPYSSSVNFICPIANIRNPDIVRFVVVNSSQSVVFKFTPRNSLLFRVTLPNGELLRFTNTSIPYMISCLPQQSNSNGCMNLNLPLNEIPNNANAIRVYPYELSNLISATFLMERL